MFPTSVFTETDYTLKEKNFLFNRDLIVLYLNNESHNRSQQFLNHRQMAIFLLQNITYFLQQKVSENRNISAEIFRPRRYKKLLIVSYSDIKERESLFPS